MALLILYCMLPKVQYTLFLLSYHFVSTSILWELLMSTLLTHLSRLKSSVLHFSWKRWRWTKFFDKGVNARVSEVAVGISDGFYFETILSVLTLLPLILQTFQSLQVSTNSSLICHFIPVRLFCIWCAGTLLLSDASMEVHAVVLVSHTLFRLSKMMKDGKTKNLDFLSIKVFVSSMVFHSHHNSECIYMHYLFSGRASLGRTRITAAVHQSCAGSLIR